jgi:hypothetical protein
MRAPSCPLPRQASAKVARGWGLLRSHARNLAAASGSKLFPITRSSLWLHFFDECSEDLALEARKVTELSLAAPSKAKKVRGDGATSTLKRVWRKLQLGPNIFQEWLSLPSSAPLTGARTSRFSKSTKLTSCPSLHQAKPRTRGRGGWCRIDSHVHSVQPQTGPNLFQTSPSLPSSTSPN